MWNFPVMGKELYTDNDDKTPALMFGYYISDLLIYIIYCSSLMHFLKTIYTIISIMHR